MENTQLSSSENTTNSSSIKILIGILWATSLVIAISIAFVSGKKSKTNEINIGNNMQLTAVNQIISPTPMLQIAPSIVNNNICQKSGFAQKWDYLTSYTIRENDTLQSIASSQLNDETRINEIMQINGVGPLIVGSTLYLPPLKVAKSSGNIKQVYGRLVEKNDVSWHLSFNGDINGQGVIIPSFWFAEIADEDSYVIGNCLTILFDDGYKVFNVSLQ